MIGDEQHEHERDEGAGGDRRGDRTGPPLLAEVRVDEEPEERDEGQDQPAAQPLEHDGGERVGRVGVVDATGEAGDPQHVAADGARQDVGDERAGEVERDESAELLVQAHGLQHLLPTHGGEHEPQQGEQGRADQPQGSGAVPLGHRLGPFEVVEAGEEHGEHAHAHGDAHGQHPATTPFGAGAGGLGHVDQVGDRVGGEVREPGRARLRRARPGPRGPRTSADPPRRQSTDAACSPSGHRLRPGWWGAVYGEWSHRA